MCLSNFGTISCKELVGAEADFIHHCSLCFSSCTVIENDAFFFSQSTENSLCNLSNNPILLFKPNDNEEREKITWKVVFHYFTSQ